LHATTDCPAAEKRLMRRHLAPALTAMVLLGCSSGDPDSLDGLTEAERTALPVVDHAGVKALLAKHQGKVVVLAGWSVRRGEFATLYKTLGELVKPEAKLGPAVIAMNMDGTRAIRDEVLPLVRKSTPGLENCVFEGDQMDLLAVVDAEWGGLLPAVWVYDAKGTLKHSFYGDALAAQAGVAVEAMTSPKTRKRR